MRIRSIKPEFWTDAMSGEWDARLALFYIGIWQAADDAGRLRLDPRLLRAELDPFDAKFGGTDGVAELLERLVSLGRILAYDVDGLRYGVVARFAAHQKIDRPTKSRLPDPPASLAEDSARTQRALAQNHVVDQGSGIKGSRDQGEDQGAGCAESVADAPAPAPTSPVVFTLRCSGKGPKAYDVTQAQVDEWSAAFPGVEVLAELRKSVAWQDANPSKRKTHRGMAKHLVSWLSGAQDRGRSRVQRGAEPAGQPEAFVGGERQL